jgi:hypothetical protein
MADLSTHPQAWHGGGARRRCSNDRVNYSRCSVVGTNSETWPMSRARRTLPDKPPLALPIGRRLRRRTVHGVHDVQPREHQELVEHVDNGPRRRAPGVNRPRAYRSIRHARRHRRDQLGRKQQSGAAIGPKGNFRRPAAGTTLLDHRKILPIRRLSLGNGQRGDDVQVLGIRRGNSPSLDRASGRSARPFAPGLSNRARDLGWQGAIAIDSVGGFWRVHARAYTLCIPRLK